MNDKPVGRPAETRIGKPPMDPVQAFKASLPPQKTGFGSNPLMLPVYIVLALMPISGYLYWANTRPNTPIVLSPAEQAQAAQQAVDAAEPDHLDSFGVTCQNLVESSLKAPATAEFSNWLTDHQEGQLTGSFVSGYHWTGTVDSQNAFGAKLRANFVCTQPAGVPTVHLESLQ